MSEIATKFGPGCPSASTQAAHRHLEALAPFNPPLEKWRKRAKLRQNLAPAALQPRLGDPSSSRGVSPLLTPPQRNGENQRNCDKIWRRLPFSQRLGGPSSSRGVSPLLTPPQRNGENQRNCDKIRRRLSFSQRLGGPSSSRGVSPPFNPPQRNGENERNCDKIWRRLSFSQRLGGSSPF